LTQGSEESVNCGSGFPAANHLIAGKTNRGWKPLPPFPNEIKLRSEAASLFDVQRWKFDVGRSSLKLNPMAYRLERTTGFQFKCERRE